MLPVSSVITLQNGKGYIWDTSNIQLLFTSILLERRSQDKKFETKLVDNETIEDEFLEEYNYEDYISSYTFEDNNQCIREELNKSKLNKVKIKSSKEEPHKEELHKEELHKEEPNKSKMSKGKEKLIEDAESKKAPTLYEHSSSEEYIEQKPVELSTPKNLIHIFRTDFQDVIDILSINGFVILRTPCEKLNIKSNYKVIIDGDKILAFVIGDIQDMIETIKNILNISLVLFQEYTLEQNYHYIMDNGEAYIYYIKHITKENFTISNFDKEFIKSNIEEYKKIKESNCNKIMNGQNKTRSPVLQKLIEAYIDYEKISDRSQIKPRSYYNMDVKEDSKHNKCNIM